MIAIIWSEWARAEQTVIIYIPCLDFPVRGCLDWLEPHMRGEVGGAGSSQCLVSVSPVTLRSESWWEGRGLVFAECWVLLNCISNYLCATAWCWADYILQHGWTLTKTNRLAGEPWGRLQQPSPVLAWLSSLRRSGELRSSLCAGALSSQQWVNWDNLLLTQETTRAGHIAIALTLWLILTSRTSADNKLQSSLVCNTNLRDYQSSVTEVRCANLTQCMTRAIKSELEL